MSHSFKKIIMIIKHHHKFTIDIAHIIDNQIQIHSYVYCIFFFFFDVKRNTLY